MFNTVCANIFSSCFRDHYSRFPLCQHWYVWLVGFTVAWQILVNNLYSSFPFCFAFFDFNSPKFSINTSKNVRSSLRSKFNFVNRLSIFFQHWTWIHVDRISSFFPDRSDNLLLNWLFFYHFYFLDKDFFTFLTICFQINEYQSTNPMSRWRLIIYAVQ